MGRDRTTNKDYGCITLLITGIQALEKEDQQVLLKLQQNSKFKHSAFKGTEWKRSFTLTCIPDK